MMTKFKLGSLVVFSAMSLIGCSSSAEKPAEEPPVEVTYKDEYYFKPTISVAETERKTPIMQEVNQKVEPKWVIKAGSDLKTTLVAWSKQADWEMSWEVSSGRLIQFKNLRDVTISAPSFPEATKILFKSLKLRKKEGIKHQAYQENTMMRIYGRGAKQ